MDAIDNCKVQFGGSGKLFEPMDQITNDAVVSHAQLAYPNQLGLSKVFHYIFKREGNCYHAFSYLEKVFHYSFKRKETVIMPSLN